MAARAAEGLGEDKLLAVRLDLQARNGVPAGERRVLPKAQAESLKAQWEGVEDAERKAALLAEWKGRFGAYFPEVVSEAKLPAAALAAGERRESPGDQGNPEPRLRHGVARSLGRPGRRSFGRAAKSGV
jgi:hypothetical protein